MAVPELPEVETVVRGLRPRAQGKLIQRVEIRQAPTYGVIRGSLRSFRRALSGARISRIGRRAKYILLDLEHPRRAGKSLTWVVHLGMTGQLYVCKPSAPRLKHTHLVVTLSSGEQLRYCDPRRFGKMRVVSRAGLPDFFARLGREPFGLSLQRFCRLFAERRAPVKNVLLNQNLLSGLGNIYANEVLFVAGIHPATPAGRLKRTQLSHLFRAVQTVLREAIKGQGSTVSDYRNAEGAPGGYQNHLRVYDREGEPCPRCGARIKRMVLVGRSAHFCPRCQRAMRGLHKGKERRPTGPG